LKIFIKEKEKAEVVLRKKNLNKFENFYKKKKRTKVV